MATTTAAALSVKLLIDRKSKRVLFAEAGKDVIDFLFSLPVATGIKLVGTEAVDALLRPTVLSPAAISSNSSLLGLPAAPPASAAQPAKGYFKCSNNYSSGYISYSGVGSCSTYVTDASGTSCPNCRNQMTTALKYVAPSSEQQAATGGVKGFVQGIVTYTVLDNLTVTPMSAISSITLLNTFAVKDIGDLQEKTVQLGYDEVGRSLMDLSFIPKCYSSVSDMLLYIVHQCSTWTTDLLQGLAILKASLESKTVLTDVFLGNKKKARRA
ncbi:unnamed protein product [Urochloa decumbens]|uniref:Uncharacterized protein n=1 Tax=Urochloa decumbens TaxID=240449 RepID=A0ABC8YWN1_9POAL